MKQAVFGQDEAINAVARAIKLGALGPGPSRQAGRRVFVRRTDGRRQDGSRAAAREGDGRRVHSLRHERVHGAAHRFALDRRAAGIRRFRSGRIAHRRDQQDAALRAAARRDRKGASRFVQHPVAGDGSRHAHRQQRAQGRFPQRDPGDDDQRRRTRTVARDDRFPRRNRAGKSQERAREDVRAGVQKPAVGDDRIRAAESAGYGTGGGQVHRGTCRSASTSRRSR